jgi:hypothetical protein
LAILFESTGQIVFQYLDVNSGDANAFGGLAVMEFAIPEATKPAQ